MFWRLGHELPGGRIRELDKKYNSSILRAVSGAYKTGASRTNSRGDCKYRGLYQIGEETEPSEHHPQVPQPGPANPRPECGKGRDGLHRVGAKFGRIPQKSPVAPGPRGVERDHSPQYGVQKSRPPRPPVASGGILFLTKPNLSPRPCALKAGGAVLPMRPEVSRGASHFHDEKFERVKAGARPA